MRAAAVLLAFCMFGLCTVPGTLSRYSYSGSISSGSVRAGLFRVSVKRGGTWVEIASGSVGLTVEIDLFETLLEADASTNENLPTDSVTHVSTAASGQTVIIAPGTGGEFKISVKNFSEVDVNIKVTSDGDAVITPPTYETQLRTAIEWQNGAAWQNNFPGLPGGVDTLVNFPAATIVPPLNGEKEYVFKWRWAFERGTIGSNGLYTEDPTDTNMGLPGNVAYRIPLTIEAAQID